MQIQKLFTELTNKTKNQEEVFERSGMINEFEQLDYGFFPVGYGNLSPNYKRSLKENYKYRIMILGNDFGTFDYLKNDCKNKREKESQRTIKNLVTELQLDKENTFFTNFYLGVRKDGTNTKRVVRIQKEFNELCFDFFISQLNLINPEIVLCLGHEVRLALAENSKLFSNWCFKGTTLKNLYLEGKHYVKSEDEKLGNRTFIIIPHPCDLRNLTEHYVSEILKLI